MWLQVNNSKFLYAWGGGDDQKKEEKKAARKVQVLYQLNSSQATRMLNDMTTAFEKHRLTKGQLNFDKSGTYFSSS